MSIYTAYCYLLSNPQTFDLYQTEFIQVTDSKFGRSYSTTEPEYKDIVISFKSGNQINLIVKNKVCEEIKSKFEEVKTFQSLYMGRWESGK